MFEFMLGFVSGIVATVTAFIVWGASVSRSLHRVTEDITRP